MFSVAVYELQSVLSLQLDRIQNILIQSLILYVHVCLSASLLSMYVCCTNHALFFFKGKEDDLMADKMEPVLNPDYPETTETSISSSSLLISISCRMVCFL
jgi:hypothetical protein